MSVPLTIAANAECSGRDACAPARKVDGLSFPYARLDDDRLVHVERYDGVSVVRCLGCGAAMHARGGGGRVRRHFAHRVRVDGACSHETALHAAAKQGVLDAFNAAKAAHRPYKLLWICTGCETIRDADLVRISDRCTLEKMMVAGAISDVAFDGPRPFAIEVVVAHAPDPETLARYEAASIPVFIVRPTWDAIGLLADCVHADESHFVKTDKCAECQTRRIAREAAERERDRVLGSLQAALAPLLPMEVPRPWATDKAGNGLYAGVAARVLETGRRLCAAGFKQAGEKPWLYILPVGGTGTFFANMGGTEEVPIWTDTTPLRDGPRARAGRNARV